MQCVADLAARVLLVGGIEIGEQQDLHGFFSTGAFLCVLPL